VNSLAAKPHPKPNPGSLPTDKKYRTEHADQQTTVDAILGCSDSRSPKELLLDANLGDLFVVHNSGNIPLPGIIASLEYNAAVLSRQH
jgi:carbonic anhydrase